MKTGKKRKESWWVYYRINEDWEGEDHLVVLPSVRKLIWWIAKFGSRCCQVEIIRREE